MHVEGCMRTYISSQRRIDKTLGCGCQLGPLPYTGSDGPMITGGPECLLAPRLSSVSDLQVGAQYARAMHLSTYMARGILVGLQQSCHLWRTSGSHTGTLRVCSLSTIQEAEKASAWHRRGGRAVLTSNLSKRSCRGAWRYPTFRVVVVALDGETFSSKGD